jgi:hypothetical protein
MEKSISVIQVPNVKIELFVPEPFIELLRDELNKVNVGHIGNYDHCLSITEVRGYWRPLAGATPYQGEIGEISAGMECKVEVNCKWGHVREALNVIKHIHPYEEPLINIIPLVNHLFE